MRNVVKDTTEESLNVIANQMRIENDLFIIRELHKLGEISDEQYIENLNLYLKMTWVILIKDLVETLGLLFVFFWTKWEDVEFNEIRDKNTSFNETNTY